MSLITRSPDTLSTIVRNNRNPQPNDLSIFKELPTELQYLIIEFIGGIGSQLSALDQLPELKALVRKREVMVAYKFFKENEEHIFTPVAISFIKAKKDLLKEKRCLFVSFEKISTLALRNMLRLVTEKRKAEIEKKWGTYSLNVKKIKEAAKIDNKSIFRQKLLMIIWKISFTELLKTDLNNLPTVQSILDIATWLHNANNQEYEVLTECFMKSISVSFKE